MAGINTFDCATAATDLLCNEETKALCFFYDDDDDGDFISDHHHHHQINGGRGNGAAESEPLIPPPSEESIGRMVERERLHLPAQDYVVRLKNGDLDLGLRFQALDWMIKACSHHNFGELCLYSATNFLDRFLSVYNLPEGKTWAIHLLAVSCLSLSAKINEVNVPCIVDLQAGDLKFLFEGRTIQRMEILVLNCLNWNMNAYTPFSFIDYFLRKATTNGEGPQGDLIKRSIQIITNTIKGIDFLEFRPSEIAAAVAVYVSDVQGADIDKALLGCIGIKKGQVAKCLEMVRDLVSRTETTFASTSSVAITTTATSNGGVTLPMPLNLDGAVLDGPDSTIATTITIVADTIVSVGSGTVTSQVPRSPNEAVDASIATAVTITTTMSVENGVVTSAMPNRPNRTLDASASIEATNVAATTTTPLTTTTTTMTVNAGNGRVLSPVPRSPIGVLDAAFFSYKSGERTGESWPSSSHSSPDNKRRKLDHMTALSGGGS